MPINIQGSGVQNISNTAMVDDGRHLWIAGSISSMPPISVGSISVATGSTSYLFAKSGADFYPLLSTSGTDGGILRVDSSVSVSTGSEVYVKGGSIQTYSPLGVGSVTGQITIGAGSIQTYNPIGVGSVTGVITVRGGSILTYSGTNFIDVTQTTNPWIVLGSVAITSPISVSTGSEVYIKAGSVQTYSPVGVGSVTGQVTIGAGSIIPYNPVGVGSVTGVITIRAGSIQTYSQLGSVEVFSSTGSVEVFGTLSASAGSEVYVKAGSIQTYSPLGIGSVTIVSARYDLGSFLLVAGSISSMPSISVSTNTSIPSPVTLLTKATLFILSTPILTASLGYNLSPL